ncbi:alpha/beta hydrolase [Nocardia heshunensis]
MVNRRRWFVGSAVAIVLAAATGCGSSGETARAGLDRFYTQTVEWGSCQGFSDRDQALADAGMQCARITVPLDYDKLDGKTIKVAISRLPATGQRAAALLTNPGGPGGVGLTLPLMLAKTAVPQHLDVIGVDVRGLGASTPRVVCRTEDEFQAARNDLEIDHSPAGIQATERKHSDIAAKCVQRSGQDLLEHVGTVEVARDFDVIRAALGDAKLTYFGGSYGSRLGSTIAELYPQRIRAMVLDGGVDPAQYMVDPPTMLAGFQHNFDAYAADCAKAADCPLGTDPARATQRFRALVNPLIDHQVPAGDRLLGFGDAQSAVDLALYSSQTWPGITKGLTELTQGRGDTLLRLADVANSPGFVNRDLQQAVLCTEDERITDRAEAADQDRRIRAAAPFLDDGHGTDQAPLPICAFWPVPVRSKPHTPEVTGLPKVVVVGTTGDPATPYAGGVNLAHDLGAVMVTYEGLQHGAFGEGIACVDDPVTRYLVDLTPPQADLHCPAAT